MRTAARVMCGLWIPVLIFLIANPPWSHEGDSSFTAAMVIPVVAAALAGVAGAGLVGVLYVAIAAALAISLLHNWPPVLVLDLLTAATCFAARPARSTPETRQPSFATTALLFTLFLVLPTTFALIVFVTSTANHPDPSAAAIFGFGAFALVGVPSLRHALGAKNVAAKSPALAARRRVGFAFVGIGLLALGVALTLVVNVLGKLFH
ncbi:MAG: hypothetical protein ACXVEF_39410 [Polyangiales bacterium]